MKWRRLAVVAVAVPLGSCLFTGESAGSAGETISADIGGRRERRARHVGSDESDRQQQTDACDLAGFPLRRSAR